MPCALFGTDGANKKTATAKSPLFEPFCGTAAFAALRSNVSSAKTTDVVIEKERKEL